MLVNMVLISGYPMQCVSAKLIMLFKKGRVMDCDNYRGISIINAIAKVYDYVLNNRLMQWYQQRTGRGTAETWMYRTNCLSTINNRHFQKNET